MSSKEEAIRDQATMERRCRGPARRVTVVYYLCRNGRHLEHPHLMELTLASPNHALYLRDVIHRLDALRGKGMAAMYSWSCKRRYKTGFVWHDVSGDDVLLPAQSSSEYVLKGSLLPNSHSPPPADQEQPSVDATIAPTVQCVKPIADEESPARSQGSQQAGWMTNSSSSSPPPPPSKQLQQPHHALSSISPSSSSTTKDSDQDAARSSSSGSSSSPNKSKRGSGGSTPSFSGSRRSPSPLPSLTPNNKEHKPVQRSNTQCKNSRTIDGVPTGRKLQRTKDASGGRSGTLESLIRAEAIVRRGGCGATSKRILLEDDESSLVDDKEAVHSLSARLKPANLLMRLVSCGSTMPMRHHLGCGFMRVTHKPQYLSHHLELPPPSPDLSPLGVLITRPETAGSRVVSEKGDSCNCSCRWSVPQTVGKGNEQGNGMPNSSYDPDRDSEKDAFKGNSENLGCISRIVPQIIRMAPNEQSTSETFVTITTDVRHNSAEHECCSEPSSTTLSRSKSIRMSDLSSEKTRSSKLVSFQDEKQKVVEVEERLASGARVIIQCAPLVKETYVSTKAM
ncbi:hypothetical protein EJB05_44167 [Eragrostis curvula]|uniref:SOSEKI DIX-like domain-containing protein n=1 Tax=Eragrostis curvula TaxID=38414 RepID=A0A5J9TGY1_9POAL|nr:hypothetical protein EJB05_44167 [Eragrostis curvula]